MNEQPTKTCSMCAGDFPVTDFYITDRKYGYRRASCKRCEVVRFQKRYSSDETYRETAKTTSRAHSKANPKRPEVSRRHSLKYKYDLTVEQYEGMRAAQGNKCALCLSDDPGRKSGKWSAGHWHIDHCHETGRVRGLVCHACNVRVGAYERLMHDVGEGPLKAYLAHPKLRVVA